MIVLILALPGCVNLYPPPAAAVRCPQAAPQTPTPYTPQPELAPAPEDGPALGVTLPVKGATL